MYLRQIADRHRLADGEASDCHQRLILLGRQARTVGLDLAECEELAQFVTEPRQGLVVHAPRLAAAVLRGRPVCRLFPVGGGIADPVPLAALTLASSSASRHKECRNICGPLPTLPARNQPRLKSSPEPPQILQQDLLNRDGNLGALAAHRFLQRLGKLRPGQIARGKPRAEVPPGLGQRLAGVKQRLDRHPARLGPADDFIDGARSAIPRNRQPLHRDAAQQGSRTAPSRRAVGPRP